LEDTVDKIRYAGIEEAVDIGFGEGRGFSCNVVGEKAEERLSYIVGVCERVGERAGELKAGPPEVGATHPVLYSLYAVLFV